MPLFFHICNTDNTPTYPQTMCDSLMRNLIYLSYPIGWLSRIKCFSNIPLFAKTNHYTWCKLLFTSHHELLLLAWNDLRNVSSPSRTFAFRGTVKHSSPFSQYKAVVTRTVRVTYTPSRGEKTTTQPMKTATTDTIFTCCTCGGRSTSHF